MNHTTVDFHAFRFKPDAQAGVFRDLHGAFRAMFSDAPAPVTIENRSKGWMGYDQSGTLKVGDMEIGLMAFGGRFQKDWVYCGVSGKGCAWVTDWCEAVDALERLPAYEAKRTDIALDTFDPRLGFDATLSAYRAGSFAPAGIGGRPPKCEPMKPERPEDSAIIRIGNRESSKYYRGYEKGKQLYGVDCIDGEVPGLRLPFLVDGETQMVRMADWFRHELELKPKTAPLPPDLIERRDEYFAGSYPFLGQVLKDVEPQLLVMRRERGPQLDLAAALDGIRKQYGNTLFTALVAHHGDISAVWSKIQGEGHNDRLLKAGVLLVEHE
jgi:DNA relaxase NicK